MPKEDEVIEMEPDHIEDAPVDPKWTRNQKGSALMIASSVRDDMTKTFCL